MKAENTYYNLLVQGFRAGQLNLKRAVPTGLAQLADPYDPVANSSYWTVRRDPLLDVSYYHGKLYLYFGVTPALVLFWPYATLTGHYLLHKDAVVIFFSVGFLASVGLLWAVWRRYFSEVGVWVVVAGALAVGWANFALACLPRCDVYEVAMSCGYALAMVTLALIWRALHVAQGRVWWLAGASLAYGLAVGARPVLLFGAIILLVPVAAAWRERTKPGQRRQVWALLLAVTGPITVIGLGLLLYNFLRFDSPFEFGHQYALNWIGQHKIQPFSPRFLWCNFRMYFLEPACWSGRFPFVHDITPPPLPRGHVGMENVFGVLPNLPLVWLALAMPLIWRDRSGEARCALRWFGMTLVLLFGVCALTLSLFFAASIRYQVEFLPALVLLAVLGILGSERVLAGRPGPRAAARWGWGLLLVLSVSFNLFAMFERVAEASVLQGVIAFQEGQADKAITYFRKALELQPDNAGAHSALGVIMHQQGKMAEAIGHYEMALRVQPELAETHGNLGYALVQQGKAVEAVGHLERMLRFNPADALAHYNLGMALVQQGKVTEAIEHLERTLQLKPDYALAHYNLGMALVQQGKAAEAIVHLEQALRLQPDVALVRNHLAWMLATCGDASVRNGARAVELAEGANKLAGGKDVTTLDTLAAAYAEAGRYEEAVRTAQAAIDLVKAAGQAEQVRQIETRLQLYQAGRPYHEK